MKYRVVLGVALTGMLLFLAACGAASSPSSSQGGQATTPTSQTGQTPGQVGTQTVNVTLFDDHISSSMMSFAPGTQYHFVVTNSGHQPYAFAMMSQSREQEMEHMSMAERHQAALYMDNSIAPGQTMSFDYTFGSSMMGQPLEFACYTQNGSQVHMRLPFTMHS